MFLAGSSPILEKSNDMINQCKIGAIVCLPIPGGRGDPVMRSASKIEGLCCGGRLDTFYIKYEFHTK